jgi:hypothetical protein
MTSKSDLKKNIFYNSYRLDAYVRYLAQDQGVNYELSPQFFYDCYQQGARGFFGIKIDENLKIIEDNRYPHMYKKFCLNEKKLFPQHEQAKNIFKEATEAYVLSDGGKINKIKQGGLI